MRKEYIFLFVLCFILIIGVLSGSEQKGQALVLVKAVAEGNTPVPGVTVSFSEKDWTTHEERVFSGKTSAEGECSIHIPVLKHYTSLGISVDPPSGCRYVPHMLMPVTGRGSSIRVNPGERKELTVLFLPADTSLSGKITAAKGKPVAGAKVLLDKNRWFSQTAVTDAKGIYRFPKLAAGSYVIRRIDVPEKSLLIPLYSYKPWGVTSVELQQKKPAEKDFVLSFGASITGRVLGPEGKPLKGAKISCSTDAATDVGKKSIYQKPGESFSQSCVTDVRGSYVLGGLTTETYVVRVKPPSDTGYAPALVRGISVKGTEKVVLRDISLYNGGMIQCRITDHAGRPAAGARVTLFQPAENTLMRISTGKIATYTAGPQGTVEFKGLNTNIYTLKVVPSQDSEACEATFSDVRIISGLCITQTFSLPQGLAVQGTVTDPEGKPVKGARVRVNYCSDKHIITDGRGSYRLYGLPLPADHYTRSKRFKPSLTVQPPDERHLLLTASPVLRNSALGKTLTVNAILKKGYAVTGTVTGPDGKPVPGCTVRLVKRIRHGISGYGSAVTDDRGVYFLGHMNMQKGIRVECTPPQDTGFLFESILKGSFPAGQTTSVNITLKQGSRITGRAVTSGGRLLPGVTVRATSLDKKERSRIRPVFGNYNNNNTVTGPKGTFTLSGMHPGAYRLEFTSSISGYRALPVEVDVPASGECTVKAVFERSGTLSGTLKDGNGKPFGYRKARISLELNGNAVKRTGYPDKKGHFSISGLFPGRYTVKAVIYRKAKNKRHREPAVSRQVVIKPGRAANLDIVMSGMETDTIF